MGHLHHRMPLMDKHQAREAHGGAKTISQMLGHKNLLIYTGSTPARAIHA